MDKDTKFILSIVGAFLLYGFANMLVGALCDTDVKLAKEKNAQLALQNEGLRLRLISEGKLPGTTTPLKVENPNK